MRQSALALPLRDVIVLVSVAFVWGFNFVVVDVALKSFPPLLFNGLCFLFCAILALLFIPRPRIPVTSLVAIGVVQGILLYGFVFGGIYAGTPAGLASLIAQMQVFFTAGLGILLFKERPGFIRIGAIFIGLLGILLIGLDENSSGKFFAFFLVLCGALSWACANILIKRMPKINMLHFMAWMSFIPPIPLFLMSVGLNGWPKIAASLASITWIGIGAVAYTGLVSTIVGYGVWFMMFQRHPAGVVAPFGLLIPVFGLGSASIVLA